MAAESWVDRHWRHAWNRCQIQRLALAAMRILLDDAKRAGDGKPLKPRSVIDELARKRRP